MRILVGSFIFVLSVLVTHASVERELCPHISAEELQVYEAALTMMVADNSNAGERSRVISDTTIDDRLAVRSPAGDTYHEQNQPFAVLLDETLKDFRTKNKNPSNLRNCISGKLNHTFIGHDELEKIKDRSEVERLRSKYAASGGFISLSRVGFNEGKDQAIVYIERLYGGELGEGVYHVLVKKSNGTWERKVSVLGWIG